jgi:hypothetical protein
MAGTPLEYMVMEPPLASKLGAPLPLSVFGITIEAVFFSSDGCGPRYCGNHIVEIGVCLILMTSIGERFAS